MPDWTKKNFETRARPILLEGSMIEDKRGPASSERDAGGDAGSGRGAPPERICVDHGRRHRTVSSRRVGAELSHSTSGAGRPRSQPERNTNVRLRHLPNGRPRPGGHQSYAEEGGAIVAQYGGERVAGDPQVEVVEGEWPGSTTAIVKFDDLEAAHRWYDSPEYQKAREIRLSAATTNAAFVKGAA